MSSSKKHHADINIHLELDNDKLPEKISWRASDSQFDGFKECKAFLLSIFDAGDLNTLRVDIWSKEMRMDEMNRFFYQSFVSMADTYQRATNNESGANDIREFAKSFGLEQKVIANQD